MPIASVTRLRIRAWRFLPAFYFHAARSAAQAKRASGHLSSSLLRDDNRVFWTKSVWESEAAMRAYLTTGAHRVAMPKLFEWCDEAVTAHWTQDTQAEPSWHEAHQRLVEQGRHFALKHAAPTTMPPAIPPPALR